jgi:hypothetical protein
MYAPTSMKPPLTAAAGSAKPPQALGGPWSGRAAQVVAVMGAAALMSVWAIAQWSGPGSTLSHDVQAFQQRVAPDIVTPSDAAATEVLARRYLETLAPDLRLRISDQVRAEQGAGLTPAGSHAFVMRRLALYEEALQQAGKGLLAHANSNVDAR